MTCIIGYLDKGNDCVYVGADSLGSNWSKQALIRNRKVFKAKGNKDIVMAISGDYKLQNILSIEENIIEEIKHLKNDVNFEHIVKYTSPRIMSLARNYNCTTTDSGYERLEGNIIFAYKNQLYIIESNGQVLESEDDYVAGGSGETFALAVLSQNTDDKPEDKIIKALEAAEKHGVGIKRPFYVLNTKNDDVVCVK